MDLDPVVRGRLLGLLFAAQQIVVEKVQGSQVQLGDRGFARTC